MYEPIFHRNEHLPELHALIKERVFGLLDQQRRRGSGRQFGSVRSRLGRFEARDAEGPSARAPTLNGAISKARRSARRVPGP